MDEDLMSALRNVIYKMEPDPDIAAMCLEEVS